MASLYGDEINQYLDATFGSDVKSLKNIENIFKEAKRKSEALKLQLTKAKEERTEKIESAISASVDALEHAKALDGATESIMTEVLSRLDDSETAVEKFRAVKAKIDEVERYVSYFKWIEKIDEASGGVQQSILSDSMQDACATFRTLVNHYTCFTGNQTKCKHLVNYLKDTIMFWYKILKDKLSKDLDGILKQINYPFINSPGPNTLQKAPNNPEKSIPSPYTNLDPAIHLTEVIKNLLVLNLPPELGRSSEASTSHAEKQEDLLLPFQLLLRPLKRRFIFHFTGTKPTNVIHKPEWYLTQILNWLENHAGFLEHTIQPILDDNGLAHRDAVVMFAQGLLQLVWAKLSVDIEEIIYTDELYSHVVDEVLLFDRELRAVHDIPTAVLNTSSPLTVLTQTHCIQKWLNIERTCAAERLDTLLASDEAWTSKFSEITEDIDEQRTPQCAETFVIMLQTMTDRHLLPFILQARISSTDSTVFDATIHLFGRICTEGVESHTQLLLNEFREKCKPYMYDGWLALPTAEEQLVFVVSQSACGMLAVLQDRLHFLEQRLCRELFTQLWRVIAENVDIYLFNEVIVKNHFNSGGAAQIHYDMTRNLFPMFGHYTSKPDNYFKRVKEGCILLTLQSGSALLLREVLEESLKPPDPMDPHPTPVKPTSALNDIGVFLLSAKQALDIIKRRVEWT
nr:RAD50-interacting protein 1-like [Ciona intestinalis]|eukprot:XP_009858853.2 RAD50-interacting protein 1-like [Ciona intestinalis]